MVQEVKPFIRTSTPGNSPFQIVRGDDGDPKVTGEIVPHVETPPQTFGPNQNQKTSSSTSEGVPAFTQSSSALDALSGETAGSSGSEKESKKESGEERQKKTGRPVEPTSGKEDSSTSAPKLPTPPTPPAPSVPSLLSISGDDNDISEN